MGKNLFALSMLLLTPLSAKGATSLAEDWKGEADAAEFTASIMSGFGLIGTTGGLALMPALAKKIAHRGFLDDINDQAYFEIEVGPMFTSGSSALMYGAHLRWDFRRNEVWTFYALGGLGGFNTGSKLGDQFGIHPRFGVGTFWSLSKHVTLRGEVSHELILAGVSVGF